MRLINTKTKELEVFESNETPRYAILSHTWTKQELTIQDIGSERKAGKKVGYAKLDNACRLAAAEDYGYVWLDTCCIDKTNNVELSEAINSMFHWYKNAGVCFAYLADVPPDVDPFEDKSLFLASRWFTRGWTLQELLAPSKVTFLADDRSELGCRTKLASAISNITGIPSEYLLGKDLEHASVAMRFSWAADRKTTKPEDIAYCLLGIFDIHMSLLYGEQEAGAFRRLQQKIMKTSDDQSIFAWATDKEQDSSQISGMRRYFSLLAPSPASFRGSRNIVETSAPVVPGYLEGIRTPTRFNNKGLHLSLVIIPIKILDKDDDRIIAILNCHDSEDPEKWLAICLQDVSTNGGRYVRVRSHSLESVPLRVVVALAKYASISVRQGERADRADMTLPESWNEELSSAAENKYRSPGILQDLAERLAIAVSQSSHPRATSSTMPPQKRDQAAREATVHQELLEEAECRRPSSYSTSKLPGNYNTIVKERRVVIHERDSAATAEKVLGSEICRPSRQDSTDFYNTSSQDDSPPPRPVRVRARVRVEAQGDERNLGVAGRHASNELILPLVDEEREIARVIVNREEETPLGEDKKGENVPEATQSTKRKRKRPISEDRTRARAAEERRLSEKAEEKALDREEIRIDKESQLAIFEKYLVFLG
jgi:hypothetical protein